MMWSDRYYYLNIYKDESLGSYCDTKILREFLNSIPELQQKSKHEFDNVKPFPFTQLLLLNANSIDNWSGSDTNAKRTNLITIVCGKNEHVNFKELKRVFEQISSFIDWSLKTDDNEEFTEYD
ncbi:hypothetical protein [Nonlabens ulvanivorans]|uniref:hypothetical protein n=1 Tax=Nonlabens ulvanivorans TaxID=906888 RepID=UPI0029432F60|nr:hypothetical protein [Nonlabens ulvanivorans]WOI21916.1 hypothetical protein R1T42_09555 [Nonlabens ulvanivorans]